MGRLGDLLRQTREVKGLSWEQVEQITKIRRYLLEALEQEAYERLPAPVFVKGLLRNYAQLLGLDPAEVIALYKEAIGGDAEQPFSPVALAEPLIVTRKPQHWLYWLGGVLFTVAFSLTSWYSFHRGWLKWPGSLAALEKTSAPTASPTATAIFMSTATATRIETHTVTATPSQTPSPLPTASETPRVTHSPTASPSRTSTATPSPTSGPTGTVIPIFSEGIQVKLRFLAQVWLRVYADGEKVFEGLTEAETEQTWTAQRQLYVHCGFGNAVRATVNGQEYGLLGERPDTVRVEWILAPGTPSVPSTVAPTQVIVRPGMAGSSPSSSPTATP